MRWTSLQRQVAPELLDLLAADDPRAIRCRRDLERANTIMFQHILMARILRKYAGNDPPRVLVDLGSGDGTLMLRVAQKLASSWRNVHVILLDRLSAVSPETRGGFKALQWTIETVAANALDFFSQSWADRLDIVTANLFLHHLRDEDLQHLLAQVGAATKLFVACELQRTKLVREIGRL